MKNNGGPAYAAGGSQGDWQSGMTLLDYFAGQALAAVMSNSSWSDAELQPIAKLAYAQAQAMIDEKTRLEEIK